MTAPLHPAATVLLLRDGRDGLEVFMVQRHRRSGFMPHAWVFPGGRVDPTDQLAEHRQVSGADALASRLGMAPDRAAGFGVAAVRETFEEAGVWLGVGIPDDDRRMALHSGERTMAEVLEEGAGPIELEHLVPWAWWNTPRAEKRRFETLFFAIAAQDAVGEHDAIETVDSRWVSPAEAVAAAMIDFPLAPPTWWTLTQLTGFERVADALEGAPWRGCAVEPVSRFSDNAIELLLPGHPDHPDPAVEGYPTRFTYEQTWVAWQGPDRR